MIPSDAFDYVYRFKTPPGLCGQRCRRLEFRPPRRFRDGTVMANGVDERVSVEFTDGRREVVVRAGLVPVDSKPGRMTLARLARGDIPPYQARRMQARASRE